MTDAELDAILASIDAAEETPSALYDLDLDVIKAAITGLRGRVKDMEAHWPANFTRQSPIP